MPRLPSSNVFVLPHEGRYVVYAPVRGLVFAANADAVAQLRRCCEDRDLSALDDGVRDALDGGHWLFDEDRLEPVPADRPYTPHRVTLFLTSTCNLRCGYCYAESGDRPAATMDAEVSHAAIDYAFAHAAEQNATLHVGFHGGGEPTTAWSALTDAVAYARQLTADHAPGLKLALTTNGVFPPERLDYVAGNFPGVVVSLDGPRDIQDAHRPTAGGGGSFDRVMATLAGLRDRDVPFIVRATITAASVRRMTEMVDFFIDEADCRRIFLEPVFGCRGRCDGDAFASPDPQVFADEFVRAFRHGVDRQAAVRYSAAKLLGRKLSFCGVARDSFSVTPDGHVTSCFEVCDTGHPLAGTFLYGRYDRDAKRFEIDRDRLRRLREMVVANKPYCENCFCRWQCAGDCPVRVCGTELDFASPSPRCVMNQHIAKALLVRLIEGTPWVADPVTSS